MISLISVSHLILLGFTKNFPIPKAFNSKNSFNFEWEKFFDKDSSFYINSVNLDEEIKENYVKVRPLRITKQEIKEDNVDKFERVLFKFISDNKYYNIDYEEYLNYNLKVNIISIRFINNFSSQQLNNKILINRFTNNTIETIYLNERMDNGNYDKVYKWEENLPLITKDSYLNLKIAGITESRLNEITNNKEIKLKILVINKNESVLDIYLHIPSSSRYKINKYELLGVLKSPTIAILYPKFM